MGDAIRCYRIAREHWIDLSTGINPNSFPVPQISPSSWLCLPDDEDDLEMLAVAHHQAAHALAIAGAQAAIRMLPALLPKGPIGIGALTYGEYAPAFQEAGFAVERFIIERMGDTTRGALFILRHHGLLPSHLKHLVIVNPNNPTADLLDPDILLGWHQQLAKRGSTLIVDEAFMDPTPDLSIASFSSVDNLIVLRSMGKFFGLAGARAGFMLQAVHALMQWRLRGPWTIAGPARAAILDQTWQHVTRAHLSQASERLVTLLNARGLTTHHTHLFAWTSDPRMSNLHDRLAKQRIWVRRFDAVSSLRFGLPADKLGWNALAAALAKSLD